MKVIVSSDFYTDFEIYETPDLEDLKECIARLINGEDVDMSRHRLIFSSDDMETQTAIETARLRLSCDTIIFTSEL